MDSQTLIALPSPTASLLMEQYSLSPLLPYRKKVFAVPFPTQYTCLIQSANGPQDPHPARWSLGVKAD